MKRNLSIALTAAMLAAVALSTAGASAESNSLRAGFAVRDITPVGTSPAGWDFWVNPVTGIWSEEFTDSNGNGYFDPGEPFVDDIRNTALDPQSAAKFDGCWTNAGFTGRGPTGVYDSIWARASVISAGGQTVALVSLDAVGFFYEEVQRVRTELDAAAPAHGIDKVIISSTHTHESCDTMGYWGNPPIVSDGKFPLWQSFIRSNIVDAIIEANEGRAPAKMKAATAEHPVADTDGSRDWPSVGLRDSRNPEVLDPYVQALQFVTPDGSSVLGTMVNWSNHPEALASGNRKISSDFPHGTRTKLEQETGAPAIYFSGSVGGLMTPLRVPVPACGGQPAATAATIARTYCIGELVADAALGALSSAALEEVTTLDLASREVYMTADNVALNALNTIGIFDKDTYTSVGDTHVYSERAGDEFKTEIVSVAFGSVRFQTVPGELFPEIEIGGYGRTDCADADTGRPYEPVIRDQWDEPTLFVLGLAQDELGYIVPGYDFWADGPNADNEAGTRTPRPLVGGLGGVLEDVPPLDNVDPCGEDHYEETVSGSSVMAPVVACTIAELAGKDIGNEVLYPACTTENTTVAPRGLRLGG